MYKVAISYENHLGYAQFDEETRMVSVVLPHEEKREEAMAFLLREHTLNLPRQGLNDFADVTLHASDSKEHFQRVLGYLWQATGVHVDWSRPVE